MSVVVNTNTKPKPKIITPRVIVRRPRLRRLNRARLPIQEVRRRLAQSRRDKTKNSKRRTTRRTVRNNNSPKKSAVMSAEAKNYMHCRLDPFSTTGLIGIPDLSDQPRVVVDHRLICNFTVGTSGGFNIAVMPWLPHPLLVRPLTMNDATWLYDGVHPTSNNSPLGFPSYYFAPATFREWSNQTVYRNATTADIDSIDVPYQSKRFRFVTIGARVIYTGSTMLNAGTMLVNDGSFAVETTQNNNAIFNVFTSSTSGLVTYDPDEVFVTQYTFNPEFTVRSNSSLNVPIKEGGFLLLKNQAPDHPWHEIRSGLNFPTWQASNDYCNVIANVADPLATGKVYAYPIVQAEDPNFCPKLISIQGLASGTPFQLELVYCVEYAIDSSSSISSLAKQPPRADPIGVQRVDAMVRSQPANMPLANDIIHTVGTTVSDTVSGIATAFSPFKTMTFTNRNYAN